MQENRPFLAKTILPSQLFIMVDEIPIFALLDTFKKIPTTISLHISQDIMSLLINSYKKISGKYDYRKYLYRKVETE